MPIVVHQDSTRIIAGGESTRIVAAPANRIVAQTGSAKIRPHVSRIIVAREGMPGVKGEQGDGTQLEFDAGVTISALQPIAVINNLAYPADSSNPLHRGKVVGISSNSATAGNPVTVRTDGARIQDSFFSFSGGLVYVGPAGTLVESAPPSGFSQSIAVAVASDVLVVQIGPPIRRA